MENSERDIEVLEMVYKALEEDRVKVFYQPQFEPKNCTLVSAEALCRIENEYHEIILPGNFIPVLEKQKASHIGSIRALPLDHSQYHEDPSPISGS